jgi:hypothetical protein
MTLEGKGFFTLIIPECEGGDPVSIQAAAQAAGLSHVVVKIADGDRPCGFDAAEIDITAPVIQALHAAGIAAWGWHSVHGDAPLAEAAIAISRTQALSLDGYVVEAKDGYTRPGMADAARLFMSSVRSALTIPIALSSYRFPNYHPGLPWSTFLEFCDLHMPQVTWEQAHDAGAQLRESKRQCDALPNARPCIPTGPAYTTTGWSPTITDIIDFLNTARALEVPAVNFVNWDTCRHDLPQLWTAISDYAWPAPASIPLHSTSVVSPPDAFLARFLAALNRRQAEQISTLYDQAAIQVRADKILSGTAAIQTGYTAFFESLPRDAIFAISWTLAEADSSQFSWKAGTLTGETTLVLRDEKILLDYTFVLNQ